MNNPPTQHTSFAGSTPLEKLPNIGKTVAGKLRGLGIHNAADLKALGAAKAYIWLSQQEPHKHLPVCYYLYSLEGAIHNRHWSDFSDDEKRALRLAAGLPK